MNNNLNTPINMKNMIQKATVVLGVALFAFTACKKENVQNIVASGETTEIGRAHV